MVLIRLGPSGETLWVRSFAYYTSGGVWRAPPIPIASWQPPTVFYRGAYQSSGYYPGC